MADFPSLQPRSRKAWRAWLTKNHATSSGVWLIYAKKHTKIPSLSYSDAVEEALCFGWIDSLIHPIDDSTYKQVFTPRKPKSRWSALNRKRVAKLIEAGLMTAAGLALITLAKKTGTWEAYVPSETLTLPPELKKAINANPAAKKNWPTYTESQRKIFLYRVHDAKRPDTRAQRIARVIEIVASGKPFSQVVRESMSGKKAAKRPS
jgi:uncharacterized protein YdeI (YjbR/CyaY-like superfamily)